VSRIIRLMRRSVVLAALMLLHAVPSIAQRSGEMPPIFDGVGVDERLGEFVAIETTFFDEHEQVARFGDLLDGKRPLLLSFVYHDCPMLCSLILDALNEGLRAMDWVPGQQFDVVTVSFAPDETPDLAARQKARYVNALGKPEAAAGWHFLTGSEDAIQTLAQSVGFTFKWVESAQQYAHPAVLIFLSGEGKITRYLYGLDFPAGNLRNALVEASEGTVGSTLDRLLLFCLQFDPNSNSYVPHVMNIMKLGGLLTILAVGATLFVFWRREHERLDETGAFVSDL
jgi:protein SCO1